MDNPEKLKYFNKTHMYREISNQSKWFILPFYLYIILEYALS
jgi:hypothetical protein